jgi:hypothetical protein
MAFTGNIACNSFKTGLMKGTFDFDVDTYYIALYTNAATLNYDTSEYTTDGEVVAAGYSASPLTVTVTPTIGNSGTVAYISFANVSWNAAFTARGALIYKPGANGAICVLDFGSDKTSTTTFTVQFPAATNTSAIIRIA